VLVNASHASMPPTRFVDLTDDQLSSQLDSVRGHAFLCRRALPGMRERGWGRIVYVSGALMSRPAPGFSAYGAAKSAATTLTRYIALENGDAGITANIVAPGRVIDPEDDTPLTPPMQALAERLLERMALDFPDADDVAGVVETLVGPRSGPITGQTLWVTGGEPIA
jgi:NAD(P)-dependent dehydrogenase (short-subunit alcohol dehydrogenase family)